MYWLNIPQVGTYTVARSDFETLTNVAQFKIDLRLGLISFLALLGLIKVFKAMMDG
jgi:hypothetical protein